MHFDIIILLAYSIYPYGVFIYIHNIPHLGISVKDILLGFVQVADFKTTVSLYFIIACIVFFLYYNCSKKIKNSAVA